MHILLALHSATGVTRYSQIGFGARSSRNPMGGVAVDDLRP